MARSENASDAARLSRRTFVLLGGSAVGTLAGATASGRAEEPDASTDVAATEPYLPSVRAAVESSVGDAVTVGSARELGDGADVLVSGRPTARDGGADGVVITGAAALSPADGEWRECLRRSEVTDRWVSETPVETWSEAGLERVSDASLADAAGASASSATQSVLVRGTRAYQYAQGRGGVGYYSVEPDALDELAGDEFTGDADARTPVVRLGYVHVDRKARTDGRLAEFLRTFGRGAGAGDDATKPVEATAVASDATAE